MAASWQALQATLLPVGIKAFERRTRAVLHSTDAGSIFQCSFVEIQIPKHTLQSRGRDAEQEGAQSHEVCPVTAHLK